MKENTRFISRANVIQPLSQILDVVSVAAAGAVAYYTRGFTVPVNPMVYIFAVAFGVLYSIIVFRLFGMYSLQHNRKFQYPLQRIFIAWLSVLVLLALTSYLTKTGPYFSRLWFGLWSIYGLFALLASRLVVLGFLRSTFFRKLNQKNILLVGSARLAESISDRLITYAYSDMNITGMILTGDGEHGMVPEKLRQLGKLQDINEIIEHNKIDEIWVVLALKEEDTIREILHLLRHSTVDIRMVPDIFELRLLNQSLTDIAGIPVINLCESPMSGSNRFYKYLEDKLLSVFFLLLLSPLIALITIIIKLTSSGPVFYTQERIGWNGEIFKIIKFRSMPVNAEHQSGPIWATQGDNRATRFGAFLRRTSLDEIPQFFNVLKGDMSIVGPRPERPEFVNEFKENIPGYMKKHMVKAGITGWAQINGWRGSTDLKTRIAHDLYYIENWSLMLDLKIIALTAAAILTQKNAY